MNIWFEEERFTQAHLGEHWQQRYTAVAEPKDRGGAVVRIYEEDLRNGFWNLAAVYKDSEMPLQEFADLVAARFGVKVEIEK